jgi:hypothetical protein
LENCANSLYVCGANRVFHVNKINDLVAEKTGCESCRPSQFPRPLFATCSASIRGTAMQSAAGLNCADYCQRTIDTGRRPEYASGEEAALLAGLSARAARVFMASRARARETIEVEGSSHVVMLSHPSEVAAMIERAARATK